ncbi:MAG: ADP-ribosylglycohydrolase family protein [Polyangiales bacterium]
MTATPQARPAAAAHAGEPSRSGPTAATTTPSRPSRLKTAPSPTSIPAAATPCAAFCIAIAHPGLRGEGPQAMHAAALAWADRARAEPRVYAALRDATQHAPDDMHTQMGHVALALQNAFYALLHAPDLEAGVIDTVMRGGDTDTNAAIAGALLGAAHGREGVPLRWRRAVLSCVPVPESAGGRRPRPSTYWPVDALVLAERLLTA